MHEVSWVKLDIDSQSFLNIHYKITLSCINEVRNELEFLLGAIFVKKFLHILTHLNEGIEIVKHKLNSLFCNLNEDTIPEAFTEILSQFMAMLEVYTAIQNPIYIRISDEIYFQGKMNKSDKGCFFIDVNGFYIEYLLYDSQLKIFRNENVKFPQLLPPVLKALDTIFNNKGQ